MKDFTQKLIVAVFALCTSSVAMAQDFSVDGYYYYINEDGVSVSFTQDQYQAWIDGVGTYTGDIVIPSEVTYEGTTYPVTCVLDYAFFQCYDVTSVTMPNSITEIGDCAFYRCKNISSITIPASVTTIGRAIFLECDKLTSVVVEEGNTVYDSRDNCNAVVETATNKLTNGCNSSTIPDGIVTIGESAFHLCQYLPEIRIPDSVTEIEDWAFSACFGAKSLTVGKSLASIGNQGFYACGSMETITVDPKNTNYDSRDNCNCLVSTEDNTIVLGSCNSFIPQSIVAIGEAAFSNNEKLESIEIPNSVTNISWNAFEYCTSLKSIVFPASVEYIGYSVVTGCQSLESIVVEEGNPKYDSRDNCNAIIITESNLLMCGCKNTVIPNSVEIIGDEAFAYLPDLKSITIPNSVLKIWYGAFEYTGLETVELPNSLIETSNAMFRGCESLRSVKLPESLTTLSQSTFEGCTALSWITVPSSMNFIGQYAFRGCTGLKTVVLEAPYISKIMDEAFYGCENLTTLQCNSYMPPALGEDVFVGVDKTTCQLLVQEESVEAYKAAEEWCDFLNTTDVEKVKVEESGIAVENGRLINNGSGRIDVYSLSGAKVYSGNDAEVSLGAGYYIVKVGKKALKIAL